MKEPETSRAGPFRADGRYEHAVMSVAPDSALAAIRRFQRPGLGVVGYLVVVGLGTLAVGAVAALRVEGAAVMVGLSTLMAALLFWVAGRFQEQIRGYLERSMEGAGRDAHPVLLGARGLRLERPELTAEWDYEAIQRIGAVDGLVVVELTSGEALVLEPNGDPEGLAAWLRERAPRGAGLASWHALGLLALLYLGLCAAVVAALPPAL